MTLMSYISIALWVVVASCLMIIWLVGSGLRMHNPRKRVKIFHSPAQIRQARWGRIIAYVILAACAFLGYPYLLYPIW